MQVQACLHLALDRVWPCISANQPSILVLLSSPTSPRASDSPPLVVLCTLESNSSTHRDSKPSSHCSYPLIPFSVFFCRSTRPCPAVFRFHGLWTVVLSMLPSDLVNWARTFLFLSLESLCVGFETWGVGLSCANLGPRGARYNLRHTTGSWVEQQAVVCRAGLASLLPGTALPHGVEHRRRRAGRAQCSAADAQPM